MHRKTGYHLLDSGEFRKLEQVGPYRLIRPCPQAVWRPTLSAAEWAKIDGEFTRTSTGNGKWKTQRSLPEHWLMDFHGANIRVRPTDFGHLGFFPEHHFHGVIPWAKTQPAESLRKLHVLHLFAYTGTLSISLEAMGMQLSHVDASKTSIAWGKENAELHPDSAKLSIRWLLDDAFKFVQREVRRGQKYEGIILDPPSFGRSPQGKVWKIEEHLLPLLDELAKLKSPKFTFLQLTSHSSFYTPVVLENLADMVWGKEPKTSTAFEMTVPEAQSRRLLPCGAGSWTARKG